MFTPHHVSHFRCHMSGVTCHVSRVRVQVQGVTFLSFFFSQRNGASWQRVWYRRLVLIPLLQSTHIKIFSSLIYAGFFMAKHFLYFFSLSFIPFQPGNIGCVKHIEKELIYPLVDKKLLPSHRNDLNSNCKSIVALL